MNPPPAFCMTQLNNKGNDYPFANPANAMRTHDCNVVQTAMGIRLWSKDQVKPTSVELRDIGNDHTGGTGTVLTSRCFNHYGMKAGVDYFRFGKVDFSAVRQMNSDGLYVVLYIDNGVLGTLMGGAYSCALAFDGAHAIGVYGRWRGRLDKLTPGSPRRRFTWKYDACADGRYSRLVNGGTGGHYPLGREEAPMSVIRDAAAAYAKSPEGVYLASGYAVKFE